MDAFVVRVERPSKDKVGIAAFAVQTPRFVAPVCSRVKSLKEAGEPPLPMAPQLEEAEKVVVQVTTPPKVICQLLIVLEAHQWGRPTSDNEAS